MTEPDNTPRLDTKTAAGHLPYDRSRVTPGIVHLGVGAFCRAHLAVYVDDLLRHDPTWGIVGASLRKPDTRDALAPQDFLYTVIVRSGAGSAPRVIGSLLDVLDAATQRSDLISAMTDPRVRIVTLTITEKGYCHDPATGALDPHHPDVVHDLGHPSQPRSAPGLIVEALRRRFADGTAPFTVVCCDNLPANGETTARVVTQLANLRDRTLGVRIAAEVSFPSTMVDRIVPATTDDDRALIQQIAGLRDAWPVVTEPFTQWVIEDRFSSTRPAFDTVGAQLVADVRPFELMKLRMLNGSHSTLAYLGYLAGYAYVSEVVANADYHKLAYGLMTHEVIPTLPPGLGDLTGYRDALLDRFANPALRHRTWQIAMDGSQKLPQRLLGTIGDGLAANRAVTRAALGVAGWMRYVTGVDERGDTIDVRDPHAPRLRAIAESAGSDPRRLVDGYLSVREIFGDSLPRNASFRDLLVAHLASLMERGAAETVRRIAG